MLLTSTFEVNFFVEILSLFTNVFFFFQKLNNHVQFYEKGQGA